MMPQGELLAVADEGLMGRVRLAVELRRLPIGVSAVAGEAALLALLGARMGEEAHQVAAQQA
jgi:hypothetical protein